jgi:hypothetical protein
MGPQMRLPAIEAVLASDAATVAAAIPSQLYRLSDDELTALRNEETALLAAVVAPERSVFNTPPAAR